MLIIFLILFDEIVALALLNRCRYKYCNMTSVKISRDCRYIIMLHSRPKQMQTKVRHYKTLSQRHRNAIFYYEIHVLSVHGISLKAFSTCVCIPSYLHVDQRFAHC